MRRRGSVRSRSRQKLTMPLIQAISESKRRKFIGRIGVLECWSVGVLEKWATGIWSIAPVLHHSITPTRLCQPQIDRLPDLRMERQRHFLSGPRGVIRGVHDLEYRAAVFSSHNRFFVFGDAFNE